MAPTIVAQADVPPRPSRPEYPHTDTLYPFLSLESTEESISTYKILSKCLILRSRVSPMRDFPHAGGAILALSHFDKTLRLVFGFSRR